MLIIRIIIITLLGVDLGPAVTQIIDTNYIRMLKSKILNLIKNVSIGSVTGYSSLSQLKIIPQTLFGLSDLRFKTHSSERLILSACNNNIKKFVWTVCSNIILFSVQLFDQFRLWIIDTNNHTLQSK